MEKDYRLTAMVFIILSLVFASSVVEAARPLKPQNWPGFTFPNPGFAFPSPGFAFPSPVFAFPSPGFAFPSPGFNFGQPGAGSICILFPTSAGCGQAQTASTGASLGVGSP